MTETMKLKVIRPEGEIFSGDVRFVLCPGLEGNIGILPQHAPLFARLQAGEIYVRTTEGEERYLAVSGGILEVEPEQVTVMARTAEKEVDIDLERAEKAKKRAQEILSEPESDFDRVKVRAALERALTRIQVGKRK